MSQDEMKSSFLDEAEIEELLRRTPILSEYWQSSSPLLIVRSRPQPEDPVYEIQLAFDLDDRLETWRWLWVDAWEGKIIRQFPEA